MPDSTPMGRAILRELDQVHKGIDRINERLDANVEKIDEEMDGFDSRLRGVEALHERIRGAKEAMGWKVPLGIAITSGLTMQIVQQILAR